MTTPDATKPRGTPRDTAPPRPTPLLGAHERLGASMTGFAGWLMPLRYRSETAEHQAVRHAAGLFDLSHMGEIAVTGPGAGAALDYAVTGQPSAIPPGRARYTMICAEDGGVLDDLIIYRLADDDYLIVANAANTQVVHDALAQRADGHDARVSDQTADYALIAIQGPATTRILGPLTDIPLDGPGSADGLTPAGLAARDTLRLEAGMPLYGNELGPEVTPFEAGLGRVVKFGKPGSFVGRAALEARAADGPREVLVGLTSAGRRIPRHGYAVLVGGRRHGTVTSGAPSPTLGMPIAMAYVDPETARLGPAAAEGSALAGDIRGRADPARRVALPFYRRAD